MVKKLEEILDIAAGKTKKVLSVAVAQDVEVLKAVTEAVKLGIVNAILVGDKENIVDILKRESLHRNNIEIIDEKDPFKAAAEAVKLVSEGKAQFIMKGMLKTADMLKAVLNKEAGLRSSKLLSHVMIYEVPAYHKLLFLTDGGMLTYPNLEEKIGIVKNAIFVTSKLGITLPKVAPICAVEVVNTNMQSTLDAAVLTQMNRRGQIKGCIIDGPISLDVAVSKISAERKKIVSKVAGDVDILLVPNIEAGNLLGKSMTYFAGAKNAGVIVGAKCPVVLVSRTNSAMSKLYSIALGAVVS